MRGFVGPNVNDFLAQLRMQSDRLLKQFQEEKNAVDARCGKLGATGGSNHILLIVDIVENHVERGTATLLGELRRALEYPELDPKDLRDLIGPRLIELLERLIAASQISRWLEKMQNDSFTTSIDGRLEKTRQNVTFWLRQFDIGWDDPVDPELLTTPPHS